jgi:beta-lactamase regulating signal transducer with metallopeptidase domain
MIQFLVYDVKVALVMLMFYAFYRVLIAKETFHRLNRMVILLTAVLSFILPLCAITFHHIVVVQASQPESQSIQTLSVPESIVKSTSAVPLLPSTLSTDVWPTMVMVLFLAGAIFILGRFLFSLYKLRQLISQCQQYPYQEGITIAVSKRSVNPFSWMHTIVLSQSDYEAHDQSLLVHEMGHIRNHHSVDVVLMELLSVIQWFNPIVWMLRNDLRTIHEYEADQAVLSQGFNVIQYLHLLIRKAVGESGYSLTNGISNSTLKKRVNMITKKKSSRIKWIKVLYILPIVAVSLVTTAKTQTDYQYQKQTSNKVKFTGITNAPDGEERLVTFMPHQCWGHPARYRDIYSIHLPKGVWIESKDGSYIEERIFNYLFLADAATIKLNGQPLESGHLPNIPKSALKKIEYEGTPRGLQVWTTKKNMAAAKKIGNEAATNRFIVNLVTTDIAIPAFVKGNINPVITILLPGKGEIYFQEGLAQRGNWMNSPITSWDVDRFGNVGIRGYLNMRKAKPDFKVYIYASIETSQNDIDHMVSILKEQGIRSYEVITGIKKKHFSDNEFTAWAKQEKRKGTKYSDLYNILAPQGVDCDDIHTQWHLVKAVYGKK